MLADAACPNKDESEELFSAGPYAYFGAGDDDLLRPASAADGVEDRVEDRCVISLDRRCFDVTSFVDSHPGGKENLRRYRGRDATEAFDVFGHSKGAHEFMRKRLMVFCSATFCGKRGRPLIDRYHHGRLHRRPSPSLLLASATALLGGDRRTLLVFGVSLSLFALITYRCVAAAVWFLVAGRVVVSMLGRSTRGFQALWYELSASSMHMPIMTRFTKETTSRAAEEATASADAVDSHAAAARINGDESLLVPSSNGDGDNEDDNHHGAVGAHVTTRRRRCRGTPSSRKERLLHHIETDFSGPLPQDNNGACHGVRVLTCALFCGLAILAVPTSRALARSSFGYDGTEAKLEPPPTAAAAVGLEL